MFITIILLVLLLIRKKDGNSLGINCSTIYELEYFLYISRIRIFVSLKFQNQNLSY